MNKEGGFVSRNTIRSYCFTQPSLFQGIIPKLVFSAEICFMTPCPIALYLPKSVNFEHSWKRGGGEGRVNWLTEKKKGEGGGRLRDESFGMNLSNQLKANSERNVYL